MSHNKINDAAKPPSLGSVTSFDCTGEPSFSSAHKQNNLVHSSGSSIVCVSAGATPLNMSAAVAAGGMDVEGLAPQEDQPNTAGESQPICTTLSALRRAVSCPRIAGAGGDALGSNRSESHARVGHGSQSVGFGIEMPEKRHKPVQTRYTAFSVHEFNAIMHKVSLPYDERASRMRSKPYVLVIILGGTICMDYASNGTCLKPAKLAKKLTQCDALQEEAGLPFFDILEWNTLQDSSDVGLPQFTALARQLKKYYDDYDGFVVLHGTDTMAYTSATMSFMCQNLGKPVVLTGSMLPMMHISSDAMRNVGVSLMVAGYSELSEVVVVFGSHVLRGTRVVKSDCQSIDAFSSPNFPAIGTIGVDVVIRDELRVAPSRDPFSVFTELVNNVAVLKLTPSTPIEVIELLFKTEVRPFGVVLQLYGSGTAPGSERLISAIKSGLKSGIAVVAATQCPKGGTNLLVYQNGVTISDLGVISAKDMTTEATVAKLGYLMGKGYEGRALKKMMEINLRGELTEAIRTVESRDAQPPEKGRYEFAREMARNTGLQA